MIIATLVGFDLKEAASIGIIGAADGPTSIFVANLFAPHLLAPISVAAYSYMSLVPLIQPPVIKALTTSNERRIHMAYHESNSPKWLKILFPILVTMISGFVAPISVPLIGSLMFGNLIRESGVLERLSQTAQNELAYLTTLLLGITIGASMSAENFLTWKTLLIMGMGLVAFIFDTAGGVLFAKFVNLFLPKDKKINPMIGACGISAFPMSGRIVQKMANDEEKRQYNPHARHRLERFRPAGICHSGRHGSGPRAPHLHRGGKIRRKRMESIIEYFKSMGERTEDGYLIHSMGTTIQALGITAGGLIGVFATLGIFFLMIRIANMISKKAR